MKQIKANLKVLKAISQNKIASQISKELKMPKQKVSRIINRLVKNKYITKNKTGNINELILTGKGSQELLLVQLDYQLRSPKGSRGGYDKFQPLKAFRLKNPTPSKRLHALGLKYENLQNMPPSFQAKLFQEHKRISLNNNSQLILDIGITARLTTKSLILYAPELYYQRGNPSIKTEAKAKEILDKYAIDVEQRLNIKLKRLKKDVLFSEILTEEIADEQHPLSTQATKEQSKIVLAYKNGKERLIADKSKKKFSELETTLAGVSGEDSDTIDKQFTAILDKDINLLDMDYYIRQQANSLMQLSQAELKQASNLQYYAEQVAAHSKAIVKLNKVLDKLAAKLEKEDS